MSIFKITNKQIVNGKIPDELLREIPAEVTLFDFSGCDNLTELPENLPPNLQKLYLHGCSSLNTIRVLPPSIKHLNLERCSNITTLTNLPSGIKRLFLSLCLRLTTLPELPPDLKLLNLSGCSSLTELPDLPPNLDYLNLYRCYQLSPASIAKLEALEEANQHNPNFQLIWPEHLTNNFQIINSLKDAYRKYHDSNPDFVGREPNISDQLNYPTLYLFHRFTSEGLENRGKKEVVISALSVAQEIKNNPQLLEIIDNKSKNYLTACVNQPVCGFAEIATLVEIAKQDDVTAKIQKAKILRVQQLIKNNIRTLKNANGDIVGAGVQVELGNAILREVHKKLLAQNIISQPWLGIPGNIAYEATIQSFLTDDNIEKMFDLAKEALLPTLDCERETIDFLCEVETDFWAMMILERGERGERGEEERETDNERINKLKEEILDLDPSETDRINQIQKQITEIQNNQSANLVKKLQQKTRDLLQADQLSMQKSISPAMIESDITTANQQDDSAGGVFSQTLEPNSSLLCHRLKELDLLQANQVSLQNSISPTMIEPDTTTANQRYNPEAGFNQISEPNQSLYSRLRERGSGLGSSEIEISGDIVLQENPHQSKSNQQPPLSQPNTNSDSSRARPRAITARTTAGRTLTSPRDPKNKCCVIS